MFDGCKIVVFAVLCGFLLRKIDANSTIAAENNSPSTTGANNNNTAVDNSTVSESNSSTTLSASESNSSTTLPASVDHKSTTAMPQSSASGNNSIATTPLSPSTSDNDITTITTTTTLATTTTSTAAAESTTVSSTETPTAATTVSTTTKAVCRADNARSFGESLFKRLRQRLPDQNLLPDIRQLFIQLSGGRISKLKTLLDDDNLEVECGDETTRLTFALRAKEPLQTHYTWKYVLFPLASGTSTSQIRNIKGSGVILYNSAEGTAKVQSLQVSSLGDLKVAVNVDYIPPLFSTVTSVVTNALMTIVKPFLRKAIAERLRQAINQALSTMKI